jgi:hypothetical protein
MSVAVSYEICVQAVLDEKWAACFVPFVLTAGAETTTLTGSVHDQAELFGVLLKIRDLGLCLISVNPQLSSRTMSPRA